MSSSALGIWKCHECSMKFTSPGLLAKHKGKFCPGSTVGRTTRILDYSPRPESPEKKSRSIGEKVSELQALKDRRSRMREVRDLEERMLLDKLDNTERQLNVGAGKHSKGRLHLSHHKDVRQLQINYERLRERERAYPTGRHSTYSMNSDSSMSIHLPDEGDIPRRNPDPQLAQLAASHGRQMEMLQGRNKDLERQREEIRRRLEELGRKPVREEDPSNSLLDELREQELRNQRLLEELRRQLADARQPINIIAEERFEQKQKQQFTYPIYYGSSLVAEISAIRQAYIQNGGQDPEVLAQLAQMLAEAQAIEDQLRNAPKQTKVVKEKKTNEYVHSMMALEMENERMQRELMLLQEQNMLARNRRKDDREDELEREIRRLQQEHLRRMYELQREIERIRQEHYLHCHEHHHEVVENPTKVIIAQAPAPPPQIIQQAAPPPQIIQQPQVVQQPQQRYMEVEQVVPYDQYFSYGPRMNYGGVTSVTPFQTTTPLPPQVGPMMPMGQSVPVGAPMAGMPQQSWVSSQTRRFESEVS